MQLNMLMPLSYDQSEKAPTAKEMHNHLKTHAKGKKIIAITQHPNKRDRRSVVTSYPEFFLWYHLIHVREQCVTNFFTVHR